MIKHFSKYRVLLCALILATLYSEAADVKWAAGRFGPTTSTDSLQAIATLFRPKNLTIEQTIVALFNANPSAFDDKNMFNIKEGRFIAPPSSAEPRVVTQDKAVDIIATHKADFNAAELMAALIAQQKDTDKTSKPKATSSIEDDISGFTIDSTITRLGHDFARYFTDFRNSEYPDSKYNLVIHERPSARWGNLLWITSDYTTIFSQFIRPNNNNLKTKAEEVAKFTHDNMAQIELQRSNADTFDMGKSEL